MDDGQKAVVVLARSRAFSDFKNGFQYATGINISIEPAESVVCLRIDQREQSHVFWRTRRVSFDNTDQNGLLSLQWAPGIFEVLVPIKIGAYVLALLRTGCVLHKQLNERQLKQAFRNLDASGQNLPATISTAQFPVVPKRQLVRICKLLCLLRDYLAQMSNELTLQSAACEPAAIIKARRYIEANHREVLQLPDVAAHSHVSVFYLCKLFKRVTGINFSDYLTRTRIQTAKELLLDRNRRINEVALDAGFRSLTHFNRVFRRLVGKSPRDFRKDLIPIGVEPGAITR